MRSVVTAILLTVLSGMTGAARAQTPSTPGAPDSGYVALVMQSAFGNVTSQSYGAEIGVKVATNVQLFVEGGQIRNVAPTALGTNAQTIAGALTLTETGVGFSVREPVAFVAGGVKYLIPAAGSKVAPYVLGGFGVASGRRDVTFTVGGADVTSSLERFGIVLGTDLSGEFTRPMLVLGGGVAWPVWQRLVVDLQFRFGRISAESQETPTQPHDAAVSSGRAGIGLAVRF